MAFLPFHFRFCILVVAGQQFCGNAVRVKAEDEFDVDDPYRVVILGAANTGKSTLCQWLLNDDTVCKVYGAIGEKTTEFEIAEGHWFGNSANGALHVLDTPALEYEDDANAKQWIDFADFIKENFSQFDQIIWVFAYPSQVEGSWMQYYAQIRSTFGTDLWGRLSGFVAVVQGFGPDHPGGILTSAIDQMRDNLVGGFKSFESTSASNLGVPYEDAERIAMEEQIDNIVINGSMLWGSPMAADVYVEENVFMGWHSVLKIRDITVASRQNLGIWDVSEIVPRLGPSKVHSGQTLRCTWPGSCTLEVTGVYLTPNDFLGVYPQEHQCGTEEVAVFTIPFEDPSNIVRARSDPERRNHTMKFTFGNLRMPASTANMEYQLCYCNYGGCLDHERFRSSVGILTIDAVKCDVPCAGESDKWNAPPEFCGNDAIQESVLHGEIVQFNCVSGYGVGGEYMQPSYTRTCSGEDPISAALTQGSTCSPVWAQPTLTIPRSTYPSGVTTKFAYKDELSYTCSPGFSVNGGLDPSSATSFVMKVSETGAWVLVSDIGENQSTFRQQGCRKWNSSEWTACEAACGYGTKTRTVSCSPESAQCADAVKPPTESQCAGFSACPDCGTAPEIPHASKRTVTDDTLHTEGSPIAYVCDSVNDYSVRGRNSKAYLTRENTFFAKCKVNFTESKNYIAFQDHLYNDIDDLDWEQKGCRRWQVTDWSECSVSCDSGLTERSIVCSTGTDTDCDDEFKPRVSQLAKQCFEQACPRPGGSPAKNTTTMARRLVEASLGALLLPFVSAGAFARFGP